MVIIKWLTSFPALFGWTAGSIMAWHYVEAPWLTWPLVGGALGFIVGVVNVKAGGQLPWGLVVVLSLMPTGVWAQPNHLDTLRVKRALYPTPMSKVELGRLLNDVAWEFRFEGWGLLRKPQGNNCPHPSGVPIACDILVYSPQGVHFDVLRDSDGDAQPVWNNLGGIDMSRFVAPVGSPGTEPPPPPTPDPPVPGPALPPELWERLTRIEAGQVEMSVAVFQTLEIAQAVQKDLAEHRAAMQQAGNWFERWALQRILPIVAAVLGGVAVSK